MMHVKSCCFDVLAAVAVVDAKTPSRYHDGNGDGNENVA